MYLDLMPVKRFGLGMSINFIIQSILTSCVPVFNIAALLQTLCICRVGRTAKGINKAPLT